MKVTLVESNSKSRPEIKPLGEDKPIFAMGMGQFNSLRVDNGLEPLSKEEWDAFEDDRLVKLD